MDKSSFTTLFKQSDANQFTLVFANCVPQLRISMDVISAMYNLDGKGRNRDYLSAGKTGITLFTLIVLIGTGWSFLKPYLQDKEKKVLMIVIPLQVVANIAQVVIDESGPYAKDWITWKQYYIVVICYIYFTRVVVYRWRLLLLIGISGPSVVAGELATLAFYVFTGYKFRPEVHNPYFVIDDEEEEAAAEALKLEDEFEL
ncbi:hypothetical protein IFM89_019076 [Coptis chinensis]|uniref:Uncharacterized protein n=1 Tax=Coptis chinensis TaxID=261450 RepID=A0A835LS11_9MAGN|nr:hypothetical protein IFM89_019076 [Coptis chinensis]